MNITKKIALLVRGNAREGITVSEARLANNPFIFVNNDALKMTGYSYEEAVGLLPKPKPGDALLVIVR